MKTLPLLLKKSLCSGILFIKISLIISNISQIESKSNKCFSLNVKGLRISFSRSGGSVDHITINHKQIEVVSSAELLGVVVSHNVLVQSICKRPVLEYACPVFHHSLPQHPYGSNGSLSLLLSFLPSNEVFFLKCP